MSEDHAAAGSGKLKRISVLLAVLFSTISVHVFADDLQLKQVYESRQTLLISHNIDLASAIPGLHIGDKVQFHGEYAWDHKGGVIHWTHKDPRNEHARSWLRHRGVVYE